MQVNDSKESEALRSIQDRLLVIETELKHLATRDDLRTALLVGIGPLYLLIISALIGIVLFLLPRVALQS